MSIVLINKYILLTSCSVLYSPSLMQPLINIKQKKEIMLFEYIKNKYITVSLQQKAY